MQHIFVDESGSPPENNLFVVTILLVRDTASRDKKKIEGRKLNECQKKVFVSQALSADFELYAVLFSSVAYQHMGKEILIRLNIPGILFPIITNTTTKSRITFHKHTGLYKNITQPHPDKFNGTQKDHKEYVNERVWNQVIQGIPSKVPIPESVEKTSSEEKILQAVDIFADIIRKKYENTDTDSLIFNSIKHKIKKVETYPKILRWPGLRIETEA